MYVIKHQRHMQAASELHLHSHSEVLDFLEATCRELLRKGVTFTFMPARSPSVRECVQLNGDEEYAVVFVAHPGNMAATTNLKGNQDE